MILAIDIGNTTITLAVIRQGHILKGIRIETTLPTAKFSVKLGKSLRNFKRQYPAMSGVIICSVVPQKLPIVSRQAQAIFAIKPLIIGKDVEVPIINRYRNPRQVGQDRLVGAYAILQEYGVPAIVIDFGTAITFDVISSKKEYLGGIIVPGIRLSAESLFQKTALLPKIKIKGPKDLIGRDTQGSILSGLFYGYGALTDGLIARISKGIKAKPSIVLTGGYVDVVKKYIFTPITATDPHLIFKGMELLYKSYQAKFI